MGSRRSKSVNFFHQKSIRFHSTLSLITTLLPEQFGRKMSCWSVGVFFIIFYCILETVIEVSFSSRCFSEKRPTITGTLFFSLRQTRSDEIFVQIVQKNDTSETNPKHSKGSPFRFLLFKGDIQNRRRPKGPLQFFSAL